MKYAEYLASKAWQRKRLEKIKADGRIDLSFPCDSRQARVIPCEVCGRLESIQSIHVHHKTYERLGNERMEDLALLCFACHAEEHGVVPEYDRDSPRAMGWVGDDGLP